MQDKKYTIVHMHFASKQSTNIQTPKQQTDRQTPSRTNKYWTETIKSGIMQGE